MTYYDGKQCLGTFPADVDDYVLKNIDASSKEVKVHAIDKLGNTAELTFDIDQNIPTVSYERVCRTPTSMIIKGVKLTHFPGKEDSFVTYSCDGHDDISYACQDSPDVSDSIDHELSGYDESVHHQNIVITATDATKEYRAQSEISIVNPGTMLFF